jgi:carboxyl-terminal processing protease
MATVRRAKITEHSLLDKPARGTLGPGGRERPGACYPGGMRRRSGLRTVLLVAAAFAGGAATSHLAGATTQGASPYAALDQLARVLVIVENQYVEPTSRAKIAEGAIKGMVAELDPHSAYLPPDEFAIFQGETSGKFGGVGVEVDFRDDYVTVIAPIEGSPAARAGVLPGDQIVAIDGKPMRGERIDKLVGVMRGPSGSKVSLTVRRKGLADPLTMELAREEIHVQSVTAKRLRGDIAYVRVKQFQDGTHQELVRAAARLRAPVDGPRPDLVGLVLDMRNNPGGLVDEAEGVADELMSSGVIYSTRHRCQVVDEPHAHPGGAFASLPVVVLVNEYTASSAELVAGALQDSHRATVVGAPTFGKGSVQTIYELPGGAGMRLTTMRYYTPSGRSIQAEGIKPDILIQSSQPAPPGQIVRERDLDGHLPAEGPLSPRSPVVVDGKPSNPALASGDVPIDPVKGDDFSLSVGYQLLVKSIAERRPAGGAP